MELRIQWENEADVLDKIQMNMDKLGTVVRDAMREAACETRDIIAFRGAEDIQDAGNFGDRWADAWKVEVEETQRTFRVTASMESSEEPVKFWPVFEYGATIFAQNPTGYLHFPIDKSGPSNWVRVPSVTIPKKFHLHEIAQEEAENAGEVFGRILKEHMEDQR